jgi:hypothetical protein
LTYESKLRFHGINPLKTKRERERVRKDSIRIEVKRKHLGKARGALYLRRKKSILLEGTQAMPARLSDKNRMGGKALDGG